MEYIKRTARVNHAIKTHKKVYAQWLAFVALMLVSLFAIKIGFDVLRVKLLGDMQCAQALMYGKAYALPYTIGVFLSALLTMWGSSIVNVAYNWSILEALRDREALVGTAFRRAWSLLGLTTKGFIVAFILQAFPNNFLGYYSVVLTSLFVVTTLLVFPTYLLWISIAAGNQKTLWGLVRHAYAIFCQRPVAFTIILALNMAVHFGASYAEFFLWCNLPNAVIAGGAIVGLWVVIGSLLLWIDTYKADIYRTLTDI